MKNFAIIVDGKVDIIVSALNDEIVTTLYPNAQNVVDISSFSPVPQVGWEFKNNNFIDPTTNLAAIAVVNRKITRLALLQRFTVSERIALLNYIQANPASLPAVLLQNVQVTTFVDLNRYDTQAGIMALIPLGLLTSGRAAEILNNPIQEIEEYRG